MVWAAGRGSPELSGQGELDLQSPGHGLGPARSSASVSLSVHASPSCLPTQAFGLHLGGAQSSGVREAPPRPHGTQVPLPMLNPDCPLPPSLPLCKPRTSWVPTPLWVPSLVSHNAILQGKGWHTSGHPRVLLSSCTPTVLGALLVSDAGLREPPGARRSPRIGADSRLWVLTTDHSPGPGLTSLQGRPGV